MKTSQPLRLVLSVLLITALFVGLVSMISHWSRPQLSPTEQTKIQVQAHLQILDSLTRRVLLPLAETSTATDSLQRVFRECRTAYKRIEPFTEYYFPATSRLVNGPPLPEIEVEENKAFEPGGLQVIEAYIYPEFDPANRDELVREVRKLQRELSVYKTLWEATELTDAHVFDALRLGVFRVISLGISGFDTPSCQTALPEAATVLATIQLFMTPYATETPGFDSLQTTLSNAQTYLQKQSDFDAFDRAHFIITYANPLSKQLLTYQKQLTITPLSDKRPLRADAETLFAKNAFDPDAYAATVDARMNPAKIELGKRLFSDPVLSGGNGRSCAGCHQPDRAFTDGLAKNKTLTGQGFIGRNTPTLLNAALQAGQFYDLRAASLENQSFDVIHNTDEMHGSLAEAAQKLQRSPDYVTLFQKAFPQAKEGIKPTHIQNALAAYERTLISLNSRFDQYMRGDKAALSAEELYGFNLFMGKAKCGICHFMPLFNGTVPPAYADSESEVIGTPVSADGRRIDPDLGRYAHTKLDPLKYAFKTPTVRNVAKTAPYMHNGVYQTLEQVVDFYNRGGGNGLGFDLPNQTLPEGKLNLTKPEQQALVAFLSAL